MFKRILVVSAIAALTSMPSVAQETATLIDVVKNAGCGCCDGWIAQMQEEGFTVKSSNLSNEELYDIKVARGLSPELWACHTASVQGYTVEGHTPAADILRLLDLAPDAIGIATPGMPLGSPGMDPIGAPSMGFDASDVEPYDVFLVLRDGTTEVFS
ncbi:CopG protein, partial [hydrothermal vent metagenome]